MSEITTDRLQALSDAVEEQQRALIELTNLVELQGEMIVALIEGLKSSVPEASELATVVRAALSK